jgi:pimeloyl-ACP methyl ester carboxylesterase
MDNSIQFRGKRIRYQDRGTGPVVVLLHGFLEDSSLWNFLMPSIQNNFRTLLIDLPGHGLSEPLDEVQEMGLIAEAVAAVLDSCKVDKATIIGHSMGGYIAMAFADLFPEKLEGLCLFHSHPFEDVPMKKLERLRIVDAIEAGKKDFIRLALPNFIASQNQERLQSEIEQMIRVGEQTSLEGVKLALKGMALRQDCSHLLATLNCSKFVVIGDSDPSVPVDRLLSFCKDKKIAHSLIKGCGHMGYIEQPETCKAVLFDFLKKLS